MITITACAVGYNITQTQTAPAGKPRPSVEDSYTNTRNLDYKALIRKLSRPYSIHPDRARRIA